jgi:lipoprotein-anchoring transpeptidase ErfK/SrfK
VVRQGLDHRQVPAAGVLSLSGGDYAIHGTNRPGSIGTFASYGCIRMYNEDIAHLFTRVSVGTPVVVAR